MDRTESRERNPSRKEAVPGSKTLAGKVPSSSRRGRGPHSNWPCILKMWRGTWRTSMNIVKRGGSTICYSSGTKWVGRTTKVFYLI